MFGIGLPELIIILVIVLVLFGAGRVPAVMRDLGKGVASFKEGLSEPKPAPKSKAKTVAKKKPSAAKRKPAAKRKK